jgi:hypothetical protein
MGGGFGAVQDIADEIEKHEPTTLAGVAVLARAWTFSESELWMEDVDSGYRHLIEAVLRMAGAPPPMTPA